MGREAEQRTGSLVGKQDLPCRNIQDKNGIVNAAYVQLAGAGFAIG